MKRRLARLGEMAARAETLMPPPPSEREGLCERIDRLTEAISNGAAWTEGMTGRVRAWAARLEAALRSPAEGPGA